MKVIRFKIMSNNKQYKNKNGMNIKTQVVCSRILKANIYNLFYFIRTQIYTFLWIKLTQQMKYFLIEIEVTKTMKNFIGKPMFKI